jgi:hypothetical protein
MQQSSRNPHLGPNQTPHRPRPRTAPPPRMPPQACQARALETCMRVSLTCGMGAANAGQATTEIEATTVAIAAALCCCLSLLLEPLTRWAHAATAGGRIPRRNRPDTRQRTAALSSVVARLLICRCGMLLAEVDTSLCRLIAVRATVKASAWSQYLGFEARQ